MTRVSKTMERQAWEIERLREALAWYADYNNYQVLKNDTVFDEPVISQRIVVVDGGSRARAALQEATDG